MKSSIIDVPRKYSEADLFGIQKYQNALVKFIRLTNTPITIALQGEWGSGKTSLMNQLRYELCDKEGAPYFPVWVNTWQYSLMKTPPQAIMSILEGCINQIGEINPDHKWNESKKKIGGIFKKMASVGAKVAASTVGVDGDVVDELFGGESAESDILQLKNEIAKLIEEALKMNPSKIGFTFYIDDLDRIDPPVAVEILELMKNIFDLDKCVFILAIDYDVVIKGLRSKFGELTDKNEREFRAFFDKIIQLPFSMPVASYNVDTFLVDALQKIEFFSPKELENESLAENLSEIARLSVGSNPRSLKRLSNTLSLISIINEGDDDDEGNDTNATQAKLINFALVCMQIAYPYVYNQLTEEPDFKNWNDGTAAKLKLRHLTEDEKESLNAATEFDEEWEKVLFRMCQKETYLSIRAFQVSRLLNKIAEIIGNDDKLGDIVESVIALSAVTNLKAFDTAPKRGKSQAALEIMSFFEHFVADLKPSIPSIRAVKGKTYGRIYERNNLKAEFRCSPKDNSFTLQIQTENPDMVEKINVMAGGDLAKYHFNYHLGKKNQNLHKWEAQLEGDYRTNTDQIKESCIEFYNAVIKL